MTDIKFTCPPDMEFFCRKVLAGEYDVPFEHPSPVILDIGANCGAFALWAEGRWPGAVIHCYEPAQSAFSFLFSNVLEGHPNIKLTRAAVLTSDLTKLYCGAQNQGQATFFKDVNPLLEGETYELPPVIHPDSLPVCDILKIDTEGCELEIILALAKAKRLPPCIMLEYHREFDRRAIDIELKDYCLVGSEATQAHRGVVKYIRGNSERRENTGEG